MPKIRLIDVRDLDDFDLDDQYQNWLDIVDVDEPVPDEMCVDCSYVMNGVCTHKSCVCYDL